MARNAMKSENSARCMVDADESSSVMIIAVQPRRRSSDELLGDDMVLMRSKEYNWRSWTLTFGVYSS